MQKLPDVEKQAFGLRAKQEKASVGGAPLVYRQGRMDCTGELLSVCDLWHSLLSLLFFVLVGTKRFSTGGRGPKKT